MKKIYALAFALLLTFLAIPGAQAGTGKIPPNGKLIKVQDPASRMVKCYICSDDMTLCVEVLCSGSDSD